MAKKSLTPLQRILLEEAVEDCTISGSLGDYRIAADGAVIVLNGGVRPTRREYALAVLCAEAYFAKVAGRELCDFRDELGERGVREKDIDEAVRHYWFLSDESALRFERMAEQYASGARGETEAPGESSDA